MLHRSSICLGGLLASATSIGATLDKGKNAAVSTTAAIRLAQVQQCPVSPKPTCSDNNCQGSIFFGATHFVCGNENSFTTTDGRSLILAGCRCCPLPTFVWCEDTFCQASGGTRTCTAEKLQGCLCETTEDRRAAVEAAAADFVWRSDDSVELDLEPSSDQEEREVTTATSAGQFAAMATLDPLQLRALKDMLGKGNLRKFW